MRDQLGLSRIAKVHELPRPSVLQIVALYHLSLLAAFGLIVVAISLCVSRLRPILIA